MDFSRIFGHLPLPRQLPVGRRWLLAAGLGLLAAAPRAQQRGIAGRHAPINYIDIMAGPGPNLMDHATSESYHFGLGDSIGVYYSFRPQPPVAAEKILPHDNLALHYHFTAATPDAAYRIQPLDAVSLYFRYSPPPKVEQPTQNVLLSRTYTVQPDGDISLIGVNVSVHVQDLTTSAAQKMIAAAYRDLLENPSVVINVEPKFKLEESLEKALGDKRMITVVTPDDGKLSLPLIPELDTHGKTVQQVGKELTQRYHTLGYNTLTITARFESIADERHKQLQDLLKNTPYISTVINQSGRISVPMNEGFAVVGKSPAQTARELTAFYQEKGLERVEVDVNVEFPRSRVVRVLGAVENPGVYAYHGRSDVVGALAAAGDCTAEADKSAVRVISGEAGEAPSTFNFNDYLKSNSRASNPLLHGDETIYVPKKGE